MPLIALEGLDGTGKSTQAKLLDKFISQLHYPSIIVREPGGTEIGDQIRKLLIDPNQHLTSQTELMLFLASRAQLTAEVIRPMLNKGGYVVCDRFIDSSIAYQGYGRKLGAERVFNLCLQATGGLCPNITIFMDMSPTEIAQRKSLEGRQLDRIEQERLEFHEEVYNGYKEWMKIAPYTIKSIKATQDEYAVLSDILSVLIDRDIMPNGVQK